MLKSEWHLVYTYPQFERKIYSSLTEIGIDAFLPFQNVIRQWSDRKKYVQVPLFPNYVFVNISSVDRFKVLINGVTRFVSFGGKPAIVPDKEIDNIKKLSQEKWNITNEGYYTVGDKVRVIAGPLTGLEGVLLDKKGHTRFGIRFTSIEQAVSIDIQSSFLAKM